MKTYLILNIIASLLLALSSLITSKSSLSEVKKAVIATIGFIYFLCMAILGAFLLFKILNPL